MVDDELLKTEHEGLLHEDEVVVGDAKGMVVGREELPLAGDRSDDLRLLHRRQLLTCIS